MSKKRRESKKWANSPDIHPGFKPENREVDQLCECGAILRRLYSHLFICADTNCVKITKIKSENRN